MRSSVRAVLMSGPAFDPLSLFEGGTYDGFYYDFTDISRQYLDDGGTTPVTASGQSIGLYDDLSVNDNDATQATAAAKPTYTVSGTTYASFDGGDSFAIADSGNTAGKLAGDFAMHACCRLTANDTIFSKADTSYSTDDAALKWLFYRSSSVLRFGWILTNGGAFSSVVGTTTLSDATDYVLGVERSGSTITLYINGNVEASGSNAGTFGDVADDIEIGRVWQGLSGYILPLSGRMYRGIFVNGKALGTAERGNLVATLAKGIVSV